ncbi:MAG: hypothetical protein ACM3ZB_00760 [bacterium]
MSKTTEIPSHHLALIAAAVAAVCGENASIAGIEPAQNAWARTGRLAIHTSHARPGREGVGRLPAKQHPGANKK